MKSPTKMAHVNQQKRKALADHLRSNPTATNAESLSRSYGLSVEEVERAIRSVNYAR